MTERTPAPAEAILLTHCDERTGERAGARLAVDAAGADHPVRWLLAPLAAGAAVVIVAGATPEGFRAWAAAEGATHTLR